MTDTAMEEKIRIVFSQSGEERQVPLAELTEVVVGFLECYGVEQFTGAEFVSIIGPRHGKIRFQQLLAACGHGSDPGSFFAELLEVLGTADGSGSLRVGGVRLPGPLLMAVLERVMPGERCISVTRIDQLERLTNISVAEADRKSLQEVIETYPVRLSMHALRQLRLSRTVACQYLPFVDELDPAGRKDTWVGQFSQGLLEQMYRNRVIFLISMNCPVYCRFCFRKHKDSRTEASPGLAEVRQAVEYVRNSPSIKEVLITGGDPFLNRAGLTAAIDGLREIEHLQTLRLATRAISYHPQLLLGNDHELLRYLKRTCLELGASGKRLEIATHFIHPDEISIQSVEIITELVNSGITVYVQTPLLKGCNDQGPELVRLFSLLRGAGAELHNIYMPCSPIQGSRLYQVPISQGLAVGRYLRAHCSDRVVPRLCTATSIGKIDWFSSGWAVEPVADDQHSIWIRTPYTADYFESFAPGAGELETVRENREGTLDVQFLAEIGDQSVFIGSRPSPSSRPQRQPTDKTEAMPQLLAGEQRYRSIVPTGAATVSRVHETRAELDCHVVPAALDYLCREQRITDVVVWGDPDIVDALDKVREIVARIQENVCHVTAIRLRSLSFNYQPQSYSAAALELLGSLNRLSVAQPLRLEIETQFLDADEIKPDHRRLSWLLNSRGITVYNSTPLLGGINDDPQTILRLAYRCRWAGIEFHHLYLAGCRVQETWNRTHPVILGEVVDLIALMRREAGGREIPRYIIRTILGEVDFGLSSTGVDTEAGLQVTLLPYDLDYYRAMTASFQWPAGVSADGAGRPTVVVPGLRKTTDFALG